MQHRSATPWPKTQRARFASGTRLALPHVTANSSPELMAGSELLTLQHLAGNQVVARLIVNRQTNVLVKPVEIVVSLGPAAIARARLFYHSKPQQYTPAVVSQIRKKLGLAAAGGVDDAMIQAVAGFQGDHNLKVDGMAGVRTLAVIFPSGLQQQAALETFATEEKAALSEWSQQTPDEHLAAISAPAKKQLMSAEFAATALPEYVMFPLPDADAVFEHETWKVHIRTELLAGSALSPNKQRELAELVYHESRHAEQHHKIARMLASKGNDADAIAGQMHIPRRVAEDAFGKPLPAGTPEFIVAEERFTSEYGTGKAETEAAEADVRAKKAQLELAAKNAKEHPGDPAAKKRLLLARAAFETAEEKYKYLPLEADAYHVQDDLDFVWTTASP